ncbi:hypothetical protein ACOSQ3_017914 [Xanthoceras sorbifolium]
MRWSYLFLPSGQLRALGHMSSRGFIQLWGSAGGLQRRVPHSKSNFKINHIRVGLHFHIYISGYCAVAWVLNAKIKKLINDVCIVWFETTTKCVGQIRYLHGKPISYALKEDDFKCKCHDS